MLQGGSPLLLGLGTPTPRRFSYIYTKTLVFDVLPAPPPDRMRRHTSLSTATSCGWGLTAMASKAHLTPREIGVFQVFWMSVS